MGMISLGRIEEKKDDIVAAFNESLSVDIRMYRHDIKGSMAHAMMLGACGIITGDDASAIIAGLEGILQDFESGKIKPGSEAEDIHMLVEAILTERIGDAGRRLHTARSRNDQVALDMRLYVKEEIQNIVKLAKDFQETLVRVAREHLNTIMPGYTHLQRAQPITLAHHFMAYVEMLNRDIGRLMDCNKRTDSCVLGAGALATTTYPIDRSFTAKQLGFESVAPNSLDAVSDRDFCIELLSCLSILMMHLSRLAEEVIFWCSLECGFAELDDAYATGSSIMPQKKNPDIAELVRGKVGRVYGSLTWLLTTMKGLPMAYNKDMQETKEPVFDAIDTVKDCLRVFAPMIATINFKKEKMRQSAAEGFLNATDCADYLVKKGLPFREAYTIVGHLVGYCIKNGHTLEDLPPGKYQEAHVLFDSDVYEAINLDKCVEARNVYGGPSPSAVMEAIANVYSPK